MNSSVDQAPDPVATMPKTGPETRHGDGLNPQPSSPVLVEFAAFLQGHHLRALAEENLGILKRLNVPLMRLLAGIPEEQMIQGTATEFDRLLTALQEGRALELLQARLRQWEADELPGIAKDSIEPSDLILIYGAQKQTLLRFVTTYTQDATTAMEITHALEEYYMAAQGSAFQVFTRLRTEAAQRSARLSVEREAAIALAEDLKTSTEELQRQQGINAQLLAQIATQRKRLDDILASVPGAVWEAWGAPDVSTQRFDFVSKYVEEMLGYRVEEWLSTPNFWLTIVHPEDRETAAREAAAIFAGGQGGRHEFRWITQDGRGLWVEAYSTVICDESGTPLGMRGVTMDIAERKEAEEILRQRAEELARTTDALARSNQELDQFAYIVSHDLRAPLRGIANLSQWIEEDLGDQVTDEIHQNLELLRGRVQRMEALIDGILQYSRVGRTQPKFERVDTGELVQEVIDLLNPPPQFTIDVQPDLPIFVTERLLLQQVFSNLIGNAIKHHHRPSGNVSISASDAGRFYEFAVADDGPGIAPQYQDKVFVIFQTLTPRDKVENTGVGLSLVKKIVEGQGGTIRLASHEGSGATFRFTWPKRPGRRPNQNGSGQDRA